MNYYNEFDPYASEWLKNLIKEGFIPNGEVDTRSIVDVEPNDLKRFTQCHFFAGIAGWSLALKLAGWADDRQIWTGSCPCQPFSVAGKGKGTADERHLWPHFFRLISAVRPPVVVGEQVAGAAGYGWFDGVRSDLEGKDYASRAVDVPACAVNAPHIRQRLYWVAKDMGVANSAGWHKGEFTSASLGQGNTVVSGSGSGFGDLADTKFYGRQGSGQMGEPLHSAQGGDGQTDKPINAGARDSDALTVADAKSHNSGCETQSSNNFAQETDRSADWDSRCGSSFIQNFWADAEWLTGADGKTRRAKPGVRLLAHGVPARVGKLRAFGNAIVPQVAAEVIKAYMEVHGEQSRTQT